MDPDQQPPGPPGQPAKIHRPKVSLVQLDRQFLKDMEKESLTPELRLFAGRCHQLCLHLLLLVRVRQHEVKQINEHFEQISAVLDQLTGTTGTEAPPGEEQPHEQQEMPVGEPLAGAATPEAAPPAGEPAPSVPPSVPRVRRMPRGDGAGTQ